MKNMHQGTNWSNHHHAEMTKYGVQQTKNTDTRIGGIRNGMNEEQDLPMTMVILRVLDRALLILSDAW
jgi:hypothetical protein